jgi:hypothetical protein
MGETMEADLAALRNTTASECDALQLEWKESEREHRRNTLRRELGDIRHAMKGETNGKT